MVPPGTSLLLGQVAAREPVVIVPRSIYTLPNV